MFKEARNAAGLSREVAAQKLYIGSRTLADYEFVEARLQLPSGKQRLSLAWECIGTA